MNRFVTFGLGAAAVVVIALLVGAQVFGSPSTNLGGSGEPTATTAPTGTPEPTPEGLLREGRHDLFYAPGGRGQITVTIPAPGWYGEANGGILAKDNVDAPDGAGLIIFAYQEFISGDGFGDLYVYGDPCHWASTKPDSPVSTVDEAVAALASQASRDASAPVDVNVGGSTGKSITLHVPDDAVFADCDDGEFRTLIEGPDAARYHQDPGQVDKLWILDVDGELVVIDIGFYSATPQSVVDELEAIVASIVFS